MFCSHEKDAHKVCVKLIEMRHWSDDQECGYGSNRQHHMWCWLNSDKSGFQLQSHTCRWGTSTNMEEDRL
jgi:hypothetical protein